MQVTRLCRSERPGELVSGCDKPASLGPANACMWCVAAAVDSLKGAPLKLAMLHKVVPQAGAILKGQGVLAPVQFEVEAARTPGCHD